MWALESTQRQRLQLRAIFMVFVKVGTQLMIKALKSKYGKEFVTKLAKSAIRKEYQKIITSKVKFKK